MPIKYTRGEIVSQTTLTPPTDPRGQIDELLEQAALANAKLQEFMRKLSNSVKNEQGKAIAYKRAPLKTKQRVAEKCGIDLTNPANDKSGMKSPFEVKDIARATIVFTTVAQMLAFRDYIYHCEEYSSLKSKQSPAVKDLWAKGIEDEYKDIKFFLKVMIKYKGQDIPHIVELQLNVSQMSRGKAYGHAFYNLSRLAEKDGKNVFLPSDVACTIVVPPKITGKTGNKLRTAITQCRSLAQGDQEIMLATNILSKMLQKELKMAQDVKKGADDDNSGSANSSSPAAAAAQGSSSPANPYDYVNSAKPLTIKCGPYNAKKAEQQDSGPAQAWAISRLSSFVWSHFTACQAKPGVTGTAANIHAN
ncbi:hypothetical protein [Marinomonas mediterranea]|uniref:hypothetical protein n=1 Tax=Marinomonas mediterranea TaxID=119864 RepID=UPI00234B01A2|nr:hypothetical protein [Marinomonas mediterranea]WCN08118.1 hypothetical protein GV055_03885 [Marinomonas mediterranea]